MTGQEWEALLLRHEMALAAVRRGEVEPLDALLAVIAPSPEMERASLAAVQERLLAERRAA